MRILLCRPRDLPAKSSHRGRQICARAIGPPDSAANRQAGRENALGPCRQRLSLSFPSLLAASALFASIGFPAENQSRRKAELGRFAQIFDAYHQRLQQAVRDLARDHQKVALWCDQNALLTQAAAHKVKALLYDPSLESSLGKIGTPPAQNVPVDPKLAQHLTQKEREIARNLVNRYAAIANWCKSAKMELAFQRNVQKILQLVPDHPDARKLLGQQKYEGEWLSFSEIQKRKGLHFYKSKWLPEPVYHAERKKDVEKLRDRYSKQYGLPFKAATTPYLDVCYTVPEEGLQEELDILTAFFDEVQGTHFLGEFKKPFLFLYAKDQDEFLKMGQSPTALGVYSGGTLTSYRRGEGVGTYVHELTHGLVEISFKGSVSAWYNEGIASFYESFMTEKKDGKIKFLFGYINERQKVLLEAIKSGEYQDLRKFAARRDSESSELDYAEGRGLFAYLFSKGLLRTYLVNCQLERGKGTDEILEETLLLPIDEINKDFLQWVKTHSKIWERLESEKLAADAIDEKVRFEDYALR